MENPEKIVVVTEPVFLKVVGSKRVDDEATEELDIPDPDPEISRAILRGQKSDDI